MLSLASPPLTLLFEAATQLLVLIEVLDPGRWVTYRGATLAADEGRATRRGLSRTFGPTEAPKAHPSAPNESLVSYPGATFGLSAPSSGSLILSFGQCWANESTGKAETVTRVVVTANAASTANPFEAALTSTPLRPADTADRIAIDLREGKSALTVHFTPSRPPLELLLRATSAEDLRLDLGAPTRHFIREDERLRIHSATPFAEDPAYFASHFDLGIDFLLDGRTHRLLKVVLHSNLPGEALFGRYAKCSWSLTTASGQTIQCTDKVRSSAYARNSHLIFIKADKLLSTLSTAPVPSKSKTTSTPREAPLVLDRTADAPDGLAPGRTTGAFPPSQCQAVLTRAQSYMAFLASRSRRRKLAMSRRSGFSDL